MAPLDDAMVDGPRRSTVSRIMLGPSGGAALSLPDQVRTAREVFWALSRG
jgi:hypothetical protein